MRVTHDTNVLVSAHSAGAGEARQLLFKILRGGHRLILSQSMLYELEEVLHYPRIQKLYRLTDDQCRSYLNMLTEVAELVDPGPPFAMPLADRDDWVVVRTAIEGNAEYLCSNDGGFFKPAVLAFCSLYELKVVKPADLLARLSNP